MGRLMGRGTWSDLLAGSPDKRLVYPKIPNSVMPIPSIRQNLRAQP